MADIKINEKLVVSQTGTAEPILASNVDLSSVTGIPAAGITGVLPVGVTGGSGLDAVDETYMHVRDEKPSGTNGGATIVGTSIRDLNTVVFNGITGASLSSNQVTLPIGTYRIIAYAPARQNRNKTWLYNVTASSNQLIGLSLYAGTSVTLPGIVVGRFTITTQSVFELKQYIQTADSSQGAGVYSGVSGMVEVFSSLEIYKER